MEDAAIRTGDWSCHPGDTWLLEDHLRLRRPRHPDQQQLIEQNLRGLTTTTN